jgi:hypothetical protein
MWRRIRDSVSGHSATPPQGHGGLNRDIFQHVLQYIDVGTLRRLIECCAAVRRQCQEELKKRLHLRIVWYIGCPCQFQERVRGERLLLSVLERKTDGGKKRKWTRPLGSGLLRDVLFPLVGQCVVLVVCKASVLRDYSAALSWLIQELRDVLIVDAVMEIDIYAHVGFPRAMGDIWRRSLATDDFSAAYKLVHPSGIYTRAHITYLYSLTEEQVRETVFPWSHGRPFTLRAGGSDVSLTVPRPLNHRNPKNILTPALLSA